MDLIDLKVKQQQVNHDNISHLLFLLETIGFLKSLLKMDGYGGGNEDGLD